MSAAPGLGTIRRGPWVATTYESVGKATLTCDRLPGWSQTIPASFVADALYYLATTTTFEEDSDDTTHQ